MADPIWPVTYLTEILCLVIACSTHRPISTSSEELPYLIIWMRSLEYTCLNKTSNFAPTLDKEHCNLYPRMSQVSPMQKKLHRWAPTYILQICHQHLSAIHIPGPKIANNHRNREYFKCCKFRETIAYFSVPYVICNVRKLVSMELFTDIFFKWTGLKAHVIIHLDDVSCPSQNAAFNHLNSAITKAYIRN